MRYLLIISRLPPRLKLEREVVRRLCGRKWSLVIVGNLLNGCSRSRSGRCCSRCRGGGGSTIAGTGIATGLRSGGRCIATLVCTLLLVSFRAFAKKLDSISNYLCGVALCTSLICPLPGAEFAFNEYLAAFVDVFFHYIGIIAPHNYVVPLRVFTEFTVAVTEAFCGGKTEGSNLCVGCGILGIGFKVTDFGVISNVTDKHNFVQCHSNNV